MKRILVAVDFTEEADIVLDYASRIASQFKAKLCIVHCESIDYYISVGEDNTFGSFNSIMLPEVIENRRKIVKKKLQEIKQKVNKTGLDVKSVLLEGPTVQNIIEEAEAFKADLIIVGSHKHGRFFNLIFGSTHNALINHVDIPVLVIPPAKQEKSK